MPRYEVNLLVSGDNSWDLGIKVARVLARSEVANLVV